MKAAYRLRMHAALDVLMDVIDEVIEERGSRLLTINQVAGRLQRHPSTVREWIAAGRIVAVGEPNEEPRVREADLDELVSSLPERVVKGPIAIMDQRGSGRSPKLRSLMKRA